MYAVCGWQDVRQELVSCCSAAAPSASPRSSVSTRLGSRLSPPAEVAVQMRHRLVLGAGVAPLQNCRYRDRCARDRSDICSTNQATTNAQVGLGGRFAYPRKVRCLPTLRIGCCTGGYAATSMLLHVAFRRCRCMSCATRSREEIGRSRRPRCATGSTPECHFETAPRDLYER